MTTALAETVVPFQQPPASTRRSTQPPDPRKSDSKTVTANEKWLGELGVGVETVVDLERLLELRDSYEELNRTAHTALPFALHAWHVAWWSHLATQSLRMRDNLRIHVFRDKAGVCVGIVPLIVTERGHFQATIRSVAFLGPDPNITELRGPTIAPGHEEAVAKGLRRCLSEDQGWDWIQWSGVGNAFGEALGEGGHLQWCEPVDDYVLDLDDTWQAFHAKLKRNIRESLRHCYNSLKREGLEFSFEVAETTAAVKDALDKFFLLHTKRAALSGTVSHPDRFATETSRRFLYDVCHRLALAGSTRVFLLRVRGEVVAARVAFEVNDSLYLYYSGFDPTWGKYGVMTTAVAEAIKYAIGRGLRTVNLSAGTDVSKTRWSPRQVRYREAVELRPGVRSRVAYGVYQWLRQDRGGALAATLKSILPKRRP